MRSFLSIAWLLLSAIVAWYMYNTTVHAPNNATANMTNDEIVVVDEVKKGSIYTQPSDDNQEIDNQSEVNSNESSTEEGNEQGADFRKEGKERADFTEKTYIEFNKSSTTLPVSPVFSTYLDSVALLLNEKNFVVELVGHTDNQAGRQLNNYQIGLKRANHIRDLLIDRNVNQAKIIVDSKGDKEPRIEGDTPAARTKNRRVELFLKPN